MNPDPVPPSCLYQAAMEEDPVAFGAEDVLPIVSANDEVHRVFGDNEARQTGHARFNAGTGLRKTGMLEKCRISVIGV